ncbi:hypothetical protein BH11ACT2_BH11ACT2_22570 [soil metagenome]
MSDTTVATHLWVAFGAAGAIGSIHAVHGGYGFRLMGEELRSTVYPTLDVAKRALYAILPTGTDWPDFREH